MRKVIESLVFLLLERDLMTLEKGANVGELIDEIVTCMRNNKKIIQLGSFFSQTLLQSPHVEELYATDQEINSLLKDVQ